MWVWLQLGHDALSGEAGEAGDRWQVAEHQHARTEAGLHAPARPQELASQLVLDEAHGGGAWIERSDAETMGSSKEGHRSHPKRIKSFCFVFCFKEKECQKMLFSFNARRT